MSLGPDVERMRHPRYKALIRRGSKSQPFHSLTSGLENDAEPGVSLDMTDGDDGKAWWPSLRDIDGAAARRDRFSRGLGYSATNLQDRADLTGQHFPALTFQPIIGGVPAGIDWPEDVHSAHHAGCRSREFS